MASSLTTQARIRRATKADIEELSHVMARSFANDPFEHWVKGAKRPISDLDTKDPEEVKALKHMRYFQWTLARLFLLHGQVDVVVVHADGREKIVSCICWVEPGKTADPGLISIMRMRPLRVLRAWGFKPFQRMILEFSPRIEKAKKQAFGARGTNMKDAWYLGIAATDPDYEGHGYASLIIKERFKTIGSTPIHLEASNPRARDIYEHYGFQLVETVRFGVGKVDSDGLTAEGEKAIGVPDFVMIKWE
ncbi:unnamed protein product [Peniophora sp. CBMAI 1063]|nr:unnamed protein product [Peniophora sp. CBMAI 1063]